MKLLSKADLKKRWNCDARELREYISTKVFPAPEHGMIMWDEAKIKAFEIYFFEPYVEPVEHEAPT